MKAQDKSIFLACSVLAILAGFSLACGNECGFFEQCDGNVRQVCGDGVDQQVGRDLHEYPCEGDNPVCVELSSQSAACVSAQPCEATFVSSCAGDVLTSCVYADGKTQGNLQITNCKESSPNYACETSAEGAGSCVYKPVASMP